MKNSSLSLISLPSTSDAHCQGGHKGGHSLRQKHEGPSKGERTDPGENGSILKVFSPQPEVPISSPFQSVHFSPMTPEGNYSSFTNEVWKIRERGKAVNSPAGMHGLSPGDTESIDPPAWGTWSVNRKRPGREAVVKSASPSWGRLVGGEEVLTPGRHPVRDGSPSPVVPHSSSKPLKTQGLSFFCIFLPGMNDQRVSEP